LPQWAERLSGAVRLELQMTPDGKTFEKQEVPVLPQNLMPTEEQRWMMISRSPKIELLLRMLLAAQREVQMILASEYRFEGRSIASRASETGSASPDAVTRLENAYIGLQEVMDDLEAAAGIDWVG
jgi:hypothetical protein